jgi:hypothetical protein
MLLHHTIRAVQQGCERARFLCLPASVSGYAQVCVIDWALLRLCCIQLAKYAACLNWKYVASSPACATQNTNEYPKHFVQVMVQAGFGWSVHLDWGPLLSDLNLLC